MGQSKGFKPKKCKICSKNLRDWNESGLCYRHNQDYQNWVRRMKVAGGYKNDKM